MAAVGLLAASPVATAEMVYLQGTLVNNATTPAVTGSGSSTIVIDTVARTLVFQVTYQGLNNNVSVAHIHAQANTSPSGPYVFPTSNWQVALNFAGNPNSTGSSAAAVTYGPTTYTPTDLNSTFVANNGANANNAFDDLVFFLSNGQAYYNLHTSLNTPTAGAGNPAGSLGAFFTAVPEIDPTSFGSVLALLTGSFGLLERRTRRFRLTMTT